MWSSTNPQNNRDLNQGILHIWSTFGGPSYIYDISRTKSQTILVSPCSPYLSTRISLFSKVFIFQFLHEYFEHTTFNSANIYTENREPPGVCQYDITNATIGYSEVSTTTLGPQFKDDRIIKLRWMHDIYSKTWPKKGKKSQKINGPTTVEQVHL